MPKTTAITCLFLDIGGVLLSNGWDHHARQRAVSNFDLDWDEYEYRHKLNFATYEEGKLTLAEYLDRTIFYEDRPFTREQFWEFMTTQSLPNVEMINLIVRLKARHQLRIVVVSNEARELNAYRIENFQLDQFVDCFISSCFVHVRKPDRDIFRLALDIAQTPPEKIIFIENTPLFVQIAEDLGIHGILHTNYESTRAKLTTFGLEMDTGV